MEFKANQNQIQCYVLCYSEEEKCPSDHKALKSLRDGSSKKVCTIDANLSTLLSQKHSDSLMINFPLKKAKPGWQ